MMTFVYLFLEWLRRFKEIPEDMILSAVEKVKSAWLVAFEEFKDFSEFAGVDLSEYVPILEIGVFSARERLAALVQKIGAMKHEVEQLLELDAMAPRQKTKFGEAMRTRDATSIVRSLGWQKWLQFALLYRRTSVVSNLRALDSYNTNGMCFPCSGTGIRTYRRKLKEPKVIKNRIADEVVRNPVMGIGQPAYITVPQYETIVETHKTVHGTCPNCKGTGKRKSYNAPVEMPFDLVDIIEMAGIMKALDEHTGSGGCVHKPAGMDDSPRLTTFKCSSCNRTYEKPGRCGAVYAWRPPVDHVNNEVFHPWLPMSVVCGGNILPALDTTAEEASDFHERMHHNAIMDVFDRENELGGDINTNPQDRMFSFEHEMEEMDGEFNIQLLKKWKGKWADDAHTQVTVDLHDPFTRPDLSMAVQFTKRSGEHAFRSFDRDMEIKFGTKDPSIFNIGRKFRGKLSPDQLKDGYAAEDGSWFSNYGKGGAFQELIADRILSGHFAWDTTFYTYRSVKDIFNYTTGEWVQPKAPMQWASVYVLIDDEIRACFRGLKADAHAINVGITGDAADIMRLDSRCPNPQYSVWFNNGDVEMPVANYDGDWHICNHVKPVSKGQSYRTKLAKHLDLLKIGTDSHGEAYASGGLAEFASTHEFRTVKFTRFADGVQYYPGYKKDGHWVITGRKKGRKHRKQS